jgi:serine/threonine protein kinase
MYQVSSAVQFMHHENVAHCDLKSANILLDLDPGKYTIIAVLADFGIARILDKNSIKVEAFEAAHVNGVSMAYAAPEAIKRYRHKAPSDNLELLKASDVYSLSIILCELLCRGNAWDLAHRQRYGRVIPTYDPARQRPTYGDRVL